ncbi:hypothetical protein GCM10023088_17740 [Actinomadura verrucosospora]|uniref:pyridoxamine 5'-phosphate oxidase family protein n=1 Tax=Actinomadura verrucosospora TaxID=46165 RepID=UPI00337CB884
MGYNWDGARITVASAVSSARTKALRATPNVALIIDSEDFPPKVLLLRGTAQVDVVAGVPDIFLRASRRRMSDDQWPDWKTGVHALYDQMAVITITPTWVKLLDFETTIPKAEHDMMHARSHDASATEGAIYQG